VIQILKKAVKLASEAEARHGPSVRSSGTPGGAGGGGGRGGGRGGGGGGGGRGGGRGGAGGAGGGGGGGGPAPLPPPPPRGTYRSLLTLGFRLYKYTCNPAICNHPKNSDIVASRRPWFFPFALQGFPR
jgi:hypothetical protein